MSWSRRRLLERGPTIGLALLAGCLDDAGNSKRTESPEVPSQSPTSSATPSATLTETRTPLPQQTVAFPDGPKDRPEKPESLTRESVREFVRTHEYNFVHNRLWYDETTEVSLSCEVKLVERPSDWYRVRVSCTGYSNTGDDSEPNATATAVIHADWFTQEFVYLVDENATIRHHSTEIETGQ